MMEQIRRVTQQEGMMEVQGVDSGRYRSISFRHKQIQNHNLWHRHWSHASVFALPRTAGVCRERTFPYALHLHLFFQIPILVGCLAQENSHSP